MAIYLSGDSFTNQEAFETASSDVSLNWTVSGIGEGQNPDLFVRIGSIIDASSFWVSQIYFESKMSSLDTVRFLRLNVDRLLAQFSVDLEV